MTYFGKAMGILFYPLKVITVPVGWLFKHRCEPDSEGFCSIETCAIGKEGNPQWGRSNNSWVKRQPLPTTPPKGPPKIQPLHPPRGR